MESQEKNCSQSIKLRIAQLTTLLGLNQDRLKEEESLYGHARPETIAETARLKVLLEQLRQNQQHTGAEPEVQRPDLTATRKALAKFFS